jgi:acyl carrier protein
MLPLAWRPEGAELRRSIVRVARRGHPMLRTEEITARIGDVLVAKLGISADSVVEVANIEMDLGATSLDMVETIMSLEDEFDIEISDRDAESLKTVGDVIALVKKKF